MAAREFALAEHGGRSEPLAARGVVRLHREVIEKRGAFLGKD